MSIRQQPGRRRTFCPFCGLRTRKPTVVAVSPLFCPSLRLFFLLPRYLSRHQFNGGISRVPPPPPPASSVLPHSRSLAVCPSPPFLPPDAVTGVCGRRFCAREPFLRLRHPGFQSQSGRFTILMRGVEGRAGGGLKALMAFGLANF